MLSLTEQIQQDIKSITNNTSDFGITLVFENTTTSPPTVATLKGTGKKINLVFDEMGMVKAQGRTATCSVSELTFIAAKYPYKNSHDIIDFNGHYVIMTEATSSAKYVIKSWTPDESYGLIVFDLGDYE
jgi:hypothetical protein